MRNLIFVVIVQLIQAQTPRNIILYIGDGFGIAPKTAARMAMGQGQNGKRYYSDPDFQVLALDKLRYNAMATTHSLNSWTTDSAPGATVYATGKKIDNEMISLDPDTKLPLETILEAAKKAGYAVGLVTTTRITHATPASFGSHIWHRDLEDYIAAQLISASQKEYEEVFNNSPLAEYKYTAERDWELPLYKRGVEIDVLMGGGARHFLPIRVYDTVNTSSDAVYVLKGDRADKSNLLQLAKKRNYTIVKSREELMRLRPESFAGKQKVLGLFASSHMSFEQDRQLKETPEPTLADMTEMAIKILSVKGGKKGFFLMVEGGRIDHLGHANAGSINQQLCSVEIDSVAFPPDGGNYRLKNTKQGDIYGSDYLIKEVLSFDYAVEEGRKFLKKTLSQTLLLSTSDHECGAIALLGMSYKGKVRTYAQEPESKKPESAHPAYFSRGEAEPGWFPDYITYDYQGRKFPKPANPAEKRIIITYASNPSSLGMGCGGNHTPQDIWIGADDNMNGRFASRIVGKGMLDNTFLNRIMTDFLGLPPLNVSSNKKDRQ